MAGQLSQALGSFALQLLAARMLGAAGLGAFALAYSLVVTATAVGSGLVGDSLTVLDRRDGRIRGGLQYWAVIAPAITGVAVAFGMALTGRLGRGACVLLGLALAAFLLQDTLRRVLMASMRFWSLPIVDGSGLVASMVTVGAFALAGGVDLRVFLLALFVGQVVSGVVALPLLPAAERHWAAWRRAAIGEVFRFGSWRALQQSLRQIMMTVARSIIIAAVGAVLFGQLEAARIYTAPALLLVQGIGSYLMSSYVRGRSEGMRALLHRADRASRVMLAAAIVVGLAAAVLTPILGPIISGGAYYLDPIAVLGWAVYAASVATVMPFGTLAAISGEQARVVGIRAVDSALSLGLVVALLSVLHVGPSWAPFGLAAGSFIGGAFIRTLILVPMARSSGSDPTARQHSSSLAQAGSNSA